MVNGQVLDGCNAIAGVKPAAIKELAEKLAGGLGIGRRVRYLHEQ